MTRFHLAVAPLVLALAAASVGAGALAVLRPSGVGPGEGTVTVVPAADRVPLVAAPAVPPAAAPSGAVGGDVAPRAVDAGSQYPTFRPTSVRLPSGRVAPVVPAGVNADGTLAVPEKVSRVGWWTGGAFAGEPYGGTVIAGHVDSRVQGLGAMADLRKARAGQVVTLRDTTHALRYRIDSVRDIPQARLAAGTDVFEQDLAHRLVLITCGGPFNRSTHRYTENLVVIAHPLRG